MSHEHKHESNPTQPTVELKLRKKTYQLVFTFKSLSVAETEMKKAGEPLNIFLAIDFGNLNAARMIALLYSALITHHPEVTLEDVPSLITVKNIPVVQQALCDAFLLSMVEADDEETPLVEKSK